MLEGKKFGFIFVDHWHGYKTTANAITRCKNLLLDGGFILFHDCIDPSNYDQNHPYGVYQAILDNLCDDERFIFYGNFGCTTLFRYIQK
jgi:hypothetical protein